MWGYKSKSFLMTKFTIRLILSLILTGGIVLICGCGQYGKILPVSQPDFSEKLFNGYEFDITSEVPLEGRIIKKKSINNQSETEFLTPKGYVYKYAHDSKRYIAVHFMKFEEYDNGNYLYTRKFYDWKYYITIDEFIIYDVCGDKKSFASQKELMDYCRKNSIILGKWHYPSAGESSVGEIIGITNEYYIENRGPLRGQSLIKNDIEQFQGYIPEYSVTKNYIAFYLIIAETDYDEEFIGSTNVNLSISKEELKPKYKVKWYIRYPVFYRKYVLLNTMTQQVQEFNNKADLTNYSNDKGIDLSNWIVIT